MSDKRDVIERLDDPDLYVDAIDDAIAEIEKLRAERDQLRKEIDERNKTCAWTTMIGYSDGDIWWTDCGESFVMTEGTPIGNDMRFCCYCGKPLVEDILPEDDETEEQEQEGEE